MNSRPNVQSEQHVEDHREDDVKLQGPAKPTFEYLMRADRIFKVRHTFRRTDHLTGRAVDWNLAARRVRSSCPSVIGSNVPG